MLIAGVYVHKLRNRVSFVFTYSDGPIQYTCVISNLVSNHVRITQVKKFKYANQENVDTKNLRIPSTVPFDGDDYTVTVFNPEAVLFLVDTLTIPSTLTYINCDGFFAMPNFCHVDVEEGSKSFKSVDGVLYSYDMQSLLLLPKFKNVAEYHVPEGVRRARKGNIFRSRYVTDLYLPSSFSEVQPDNIAYAFVDDAAIKNIHVDSSNSVFKSLDGIMMTKDGSEIVYYPSGRSDEVFHIPDGVKVVNSQNFYFAHLRRLYFPSSVDTVANNILCNRDLGSLDTAYIPKSVKLNDFAFELDRKIIIIRR